LREKSKALFGNRDRLEVLAAIARSQDAAVNATDLALELGILNPRVRTQLIALAEAGLLAPAPTEDVKRWYVKRESPFWGGCLDLLDDEPG
jgi:DNA-binding IclR family transcriptional regulator